MTPARRLLWLLALAAPAHAGENATNCTARRDACHTLTVLCASGSPRACASARKCWAAVDKDCGK